jgi:hypothetical protein
MQSYASLGRVSLIVAAISSAACTSDENKGEVCDPVTPSACPSPAPKYADVALIIKARCSSCHSDGQMQWPLSTYSDVADWHDQIRVLIQSCMMPPLDAGIEMPVDERDTILAWIRCGMPQ